MAEVKNDFVGKLLTRRRFLQGSLGAVAIAVGVAAGCNKPSRAGQPTSPSQFPEASPAPLPVGLKPAAAEQTLVKQGIEQLNPPPVSIPTNVYRYQNKGGEGDALFPSGTFKDFFNIIPLDTDLYLTPEHLQYFNQALDRYLKNNPLKNENIDPNDPKLLVPVHNNPQHLSVHQEAYSLPNGTKGISYAYIFNTPQTSLLYQVFVPNKGSLSEKLIVPLDASGNLTVANSQPLTPDQIKSAADNAFINPPPASDWVPGEGMITAQRDGLSYQAFASHPGQIEVTSNAAGIPKS